MAYGTLSINIGILQALKSRISLYWALEPTCSILMLVWSFGSLMTSGPYEMVYLGHLKRAVSWVER